MKKYKNSYFVHNDGRNDYDVLVKDDGSTWVLKEEYFEFNGEVKTQNKTELADEKKCQSLFDEIEEKCLSGILTSIGREIDL